MALEYFSSICFRAVLCVAVQNCPSIVDDQFFKLSEMEHFLEHEEQHEAGQHDSSSDESVDFFRPSDDDATDEVCVCFFFCFIHCSLCVVSA